MNDNSQRAGSGPRGQASVPPPPDPRRRTDQRYPTSLELRAKCSTWQSFNHLFALNIAKTGLFIPTSQSVAIGEEAEVLLQAPDKSTIRLEATVRHVLPPLPNRPGGLGLEVRGVRPEDQRRFDNLVELAARDSEVATATDDSTELPRPTTTQNHPLPPPAPPQTTSRARPSARPPLPNTRTERVEQKAAPPPAVAIDFGTSRSSVAVIIKRRIHVLRIPTGGWDIPSIIGFQDDGSVLVGDAARSLLEKSPDRVLKSPKRLLGRRYSEREMQRYLASLAVPHSAGPNDEIVITIAGASYTLEQLCAPIIFRLKQIAEKALKQEIKEAVLTTPVSFDETRYRALRGAAALAGLSSVHFVDEPSAASLANRSDANFKGTVAVYDFGGGTFDFSVLDVKGADIQVLSTAGDTWLGGDDFDECLANAAVDDFWRQTDVQIRNQVVEWQRVLFEAERAKRELSARESTLMNVSGVALRAAGSLDLEYPVSQQKFNDISKNIIQRSLDTCEQALEFSGHKPSALSAVYLSGGTSYIPAVRRAVGKYFGQEPRIVAPPERAVVTGAAAYAALRQSSALARN